MVHKTPFQKWYEANKEALSKKRKTKYKEDASYREKIVSARRNKTKERQATRVVELGDHIFNLQQVAESLDVSIWRLREWRRKSYFPEPKRYGRELWFTEAQVSLLKRLVPVTNSRSDKSKLEDEISFILVNWN